MNENDDQKPPVARRNTTRRTAPKRKNSPASRPPARKAGKKSHKIAVNRIHPWEEVRTAYVEGLERDKDIHLPNLKELADLFNIPYQSVRARSSNERWPELRNQHQLQIARERQLKRARKLAKDAGEFDEKAHQAANIGMGMVLTRLAEIAKEVQVRKAFREDAMERLANNQPVSKEELYSAIYHRELEGLASAASRFQEIGMRALGTDTQKIELSGPDGGAIEVHGTSVVEELKRDDPERLAQMIEALEQSGLTTAGKERLLALREADNIEDAVMIEDPEDGENDEG